MNNRIYIYGNGSAGNHGCEALTRSLNKILSPIGNLSFYSLNCEEDFYYGLNKITDLYPLISDFSNNSIYYLLYRIKQHFRYSDVRYYNWLYKSFLENVVSGCVYLSAGGDNYSYGFNTWIECLNKGINIRGGKTALIGCSILENITSRHMIDDLSLYHTIVARESITYSALKNAGVKSHIIICPDPAFKLDRTYLPLPDGFEEGNTVGVNISPMVVERESKKGILLSNYVELINHIINKTDMQVALIPHVIWGHTDDRIPLTTLYNYFKDTKRVVMIKDHNAEELKGFISRCRFMIAARTHASIAAYSECVPTLVIGYSVKSKGIAKDLFGEYDGYVVPIDGIKKNDDLLSAFIELQNRENHIRTIYANLMPAYINRTSDIADAVKSIIA